ncbi:MAG: sigma 54-interacting transcriptional regulator [Treponema sp.]|nr:sigma 54-interacting transcriptional regulator [Treponema sp.]
MEIRLFLHADRFFIENRFGSDVTVLIDVSLPDKTVRAVITYLQSFQNASFYLISQTNKLKGYPYKVIRIPQDMPFLRKQLSEAAGLPEYLNPLDRIQGKSQAAENLRTMIKTLAGVSSPLLLQGQSGTGKSLAAQVMHELSLRKDGPFFRVNVAAIPPALVEAELFGTVPGAFTDAKIRGGYFASAKGGTLFFDEIAEFPLDLQPKLLYAVDNGAYRPVGSDAEVKSDVRLIFATNADLQELVKKRLFRDDLYYRISRMILRLPSLDERREDIPQLSRSFLLQFGKRLSSDAEKYVCSLTWAGGNIRLLYSCLERAGAECPRDCIDVSDIQSSLAGL